jgi:hypothetical protein
MRSGSIWPGRPPAPSCSMSRISGWRPSPRTSPAPTATGRTGGASFGSASRSSASRRRSPLACGRSLGFGHRRRDETASGPSDRPGRGPRRVRPLKCIRPGRRARSESG